MRRALAVLAAVLVLLSATPAEAGDPTKDRQAAQARANEAAARLARAQSQLTRAERDLAAVESQRDATRAEIAAVTEKVKSVAVRSYISGGAAGRVAVQADPGRTARARAMARYVTGGDRDAIDRLSALREDLEVSAKRFEAARATHQKRVGELRAARSAAMAELQRLAAIEKQHLARIAREREAAARRSAARPAAAGRSRVSGRTGVIATGEWVCPVQGPRSFSNDWGAPRSGGRRHQGNDILSPRGTPVVASVSGVVRHHNSSLGGLSYYLRGDDGNVYFGTHLSGYAASGRVSAGTVVGYVGDTGNARGTPHLHFEIHPGGGAPVNPYPTLSRYC